MRQTPKPTKDQLSLALYTEPHVEVAAEIHAALIEALAELLLEAHGQETTCILPATGESDEH